MRFTRALFTALCFTVAACGGSDSSTAPSSASLKIVLPAASMASGTSMQASATIDGAPAPGTTWESANPSIVAVSGDGTLTGALAGSTTIRARSGTLSATATVRVDPGAPVAITIALGDGQAGAPGGTLADPLCTTVVDAAGNMIIGAVVTYTIASGGGQLAAPTAPATGGDGLAISGRWTLGPLVGEQTVVASSPGAGSVTFRALAQ